MTLSKKTKNNGKIRVLTKPQVQKLIRDGLTKLGITKAKFQKWSCCEQNKTLLGSHIRMLMSMLRYAKEKK